VLVEQAALALLTYIEEETDGFRILSRDSPVAGATGTFSSLLNDIASQVEHIMSREFSSRGINLSRIESRPRRIGLGHYMFVCDLEGGVAEPGVADAIAGLGGHCESVRVLGSFAGGV